LSAARTRLAAAEDVLTHLSDAEAAEVRWWLARDAAWLALRDGAYEQAEAQLHAAIETVAERPLAMAHLCNLLGITAAGQGRADDAQAAYRRALAAARQIDATERIAAISLNLGNLAVDQNDYQAGIEWYGRAIRERAKQGNRSGLARAYANLGTLHGTRAEYVEAARYLEEAIRIRARTGHVESAVYEANLGEVHLRQGRLDAAGPYLERAIAQCRAGIAPGYLLPDALQNLAELRLAQGDAEAAIAAAEEALLLAEDAGNKPHAGIARRVLGEAQASLADPQAAQTLDTAIDVLETLELPLELGNAYAARARITVDPAQAARLRADARALFEAVGATAELARLQAAQRA
jgi:tetratricopeptide (TPR) repeat protein